MATEHFYQIHEISVSVKGDHLEIMEELSQEWRFFRCGPVPSPRISLSVTRKDNLDESRTPRAEIHRHADDEINWITRDMACVLNIPNRTVNLYITRSCQTDAAVVVLFGVIGFFVHLDLCRTGDLAAFHGASLFKDGRAILLLGKTSSGKTSLSYLMTKYGFTYLSEEDSFIRLEGSGTFQVLPYPRRLRITRNVMNKHQELALLPYEKILVQSMDEEVFRIDPRKPFPETAPLNQVIFLNNDINHLSITLNAMSKSEAFASLLASLEVAKIQDSPKTAWEELRLHNRTAFNVAKSIVDRLTVSHVKYNIIKDFSNLPGIVSQIFEGR